VGQDVLGDAVAEIGVGRIVAQVDEGEDGDGLGVERRAVVLKNRK